MSRITEDPRDRLDASGHFKKSLAARIRASVSLFSTFVGLLFTAGCGITYNTLPLTVEPNSVSFGDVAVGQTQMATVTVRNAGYTAINLSGVQSDDAAFAPAGLASSIPAGGTSTLQVVFAPSTSKSYNSYISISTAAGTTKVPVSGTGRQVSSPAPPAPKLVLSASTLNFGSTQLGSKASQTLTITSSGAAPLAINQVAITGTQFTYGDPGLPVTLKPGQQMMLTLDFDPAAAGPDAETLTITSNATPPDVRVTLSGTGTPAPTLQLTASATSLSFGNVPVNTAATLPLTLTSSGTAPVTISGTTVSGARYTVSGAALPLTLNSGQTTTLQLTFDPAIAGAATGTLAINSNASSGTIHLALSGTGSAPLSPQLTVSPTALIFGDVTLNTTSSLQVMLSSTGTVPVTVRAATLSGADLVASGSAFPVTINPGQVVTIQVQFDPTIAGATTGQLKVTSNSATNSTALVQITGNAVAVQHSIDLSWNAPTTSSDLLVGYNIYRSPNGGATFTKLNGSPETVLDYTDNAVQSGTTYTYIVKSVDASGQESGPSNQISLSVP